MPRVFTHEIENESLFDYWPNDAMVIPENISKSVSDIELAISRESKTESFN